MRKAAVWGGRVVPAIGRPESERAAVSTRDGEAWRDAVGEGWRLVNRGRGARAAGVGEPERDPGVRSGPAVLREACRLEEARRAVEGSRQLAATRRRMGG